MTKTLPRIDGLTTGAALLARHERIPPHLQPLLNYLSKWTYGREHAVKGALLMSRFNISKRELNDQIHDLRVLGCPICSAVTGEHRGLYWARTHDELAETIAWLKARIAGSAEAIRALEHTAARPLAQSPPVLPVQKVMF